MKRLFVLCVVSVLCVLYPEAHATQSVLFKRRPVAASTHNHPATPLLYEDFENATGYDLAGWGEDVVSPGVMNEDYTATVLYGTQSLFVDMAPDDQTMTTNSFTASDHVWASFQLRVVSLDSSTDSTVLRLNDASGNCQVRVTVNSDGDFRVQFACTGTAYQSATLVAINTTYTVWLEYWNDNGADAYATLAFSTDGIRPTSGDAFIDGTGTATATQVSHVQIGRPSGAGGEEASFIMDHLLIDDEQIGNKP